jgi:hypothetical protein
LWTWYDNGGIGHVAAYLRSLDISNSDPKALPPKTTAFWEIVDASRPPEDAELADVIDELGNPKAFTLATLKSKAAGRPIYVWLDDRKNRRVIPRRLEACDYAPVRNDSDMRDGQWKIQGTRQTVYADRKLPIRDRARRQRRDLTRKLQGFCVDVLRSNHYIGNSAVRCVRCVERMAHHRKLERAALAH